MTLWVWEEKEDTTAATGKCNGLRLIEAYLGLYLPDDSLKFLESPLDISHQAFSAAEPTTHAGLTNEKDSSIAGQPSTHCWATEGCDRPCDDSRMTYPTLHQKSCSPHVRVLVPH